MVASEGEKVSVLVQKGESAPVAVSAVPALQGLGWERPWLPPAIVPGRTLGYDGGPAQPVSLLTPRLVLSGWKAHGAALVRFDNPAH